MECRHMTNQEAVDIVLQEYAAIRGTLGLGKQEVMEPLRFLARAELEAIIRPGRMRARVMAPEISEGEEGAALREATQVRQEAKVPMV